VAHLQQLLLAQVVQEPQVVMVQVEALRAVAVAALSDMVVQVYQAERVVAALLDFT
jgi:hypothetical protein